VCMVLTLTGKQVHITVSLLHFAGRLLSVFVIIKFVHKYVK